MTQTAPPTTDGAQTQQFLLFDLGKTIAPLAPAEPPPQREATPTSATRSNKRSHHPAAKVTTQPTPAAPVRLEITPTPTPPELPPLQLAAVRAALCQALAAQVSSCGRGCTSMCSNGGSSASFVSGSQADHPCILPGVVVLVPGVTKLCLRLVSLRFPCSQASM